MTLIVHEDPAARAQLRRLLQEEGFETDDAGDGYEAIRKVWQGRYDTVFADLGLQRMDGATLATHIREIAPEVRVVLIDGRPLKLAQSA
ncbi:MAG TPA: response regulator [Polyangia bacterium]|jgi:DNA-binding response OmpR family regulator